MHETSDAHPPAAETAAVSILGQAALAGAIGAVTVVIFGIDLLMPGNFLVCVLYFVPLLLCARSRLPLMLWGTVGACVGLTFLDLLIGRQPIAAVWYLPWINRGIVSLSLLAGAGLVQRIMRTREALESANAQLEQRRREAVESAESRTRFLAAVSHDIRTPANAINLLAELILRTTEHNSPDGPLAEVPRMARDLQSTALSLVRIVSDVLDVTRYDFSKPEFKPTEFTLLDFFEDLARVHRPLAEAKGLALDFDPPPEILLRADRVKLLRVISNLLGNAIKFTEKGSVTLTVAWPAGGGLRITVRDTGPGIEGENLPRIFDEFFQIKHRVRNRAHGSGLGLAIARRLAEAMGGSVGAESQVGVGSTFTVTLPESMVVKRSGVSVLSEPGCPQPGAVLEASKTGLGTARL
jgi:signal transduction histidine kinase